MAPKNQGAIEYSIVLIPYAYTFPVTPCIEAALNQVAQYVNTLCITPNELLATKKSLALLVFLNPPFPKNRSNIVYIAKCNM